MFNSQKIRSLISVRADPSRGFVTILLPAITLGNLSRWRLNNFAGEGFRVKKSGCVGERGVKEKEEERVAREWIDMNNSLIVMNFFLIIYVVQIKCLMFYSL